MFGTHRSRQWRRHSPRLVAVLGATLVLASGVSVATAARSGEFRDEFASLDASRWVTISRPAGLGARRARQRRSGRRSARREAPRRTARRRRTAHRRSVPVRHVPGGTQGRGRTLIAHCVLPLRHTGLRARDRHRALERRQPSNHVHDLLQRQADELGHQAAPVRRPSRLPRVHHRLPSRVRAVPGRRNAHAAVHEWGDAAMHLFITAWFPSWLEGQSPATDRHVDVDWIEFVER